MPVARPEFRALDHARVKHADFLDLGFLARAHEHHHLAGLERAGENAHMRNDAAI